MINTTFKIGDRVKIINCCVIEPYELNKVGTIVDTAVYDAGRLTYIVDMGRPRRPDNDEDDETSWWLSAEHIELASKPNEQLLFNFMNE